MSCVCRNGRRGRRHADGGQRCFAGTPQLMAPNRIRGQLAALYFLCANLVGLGLGPTTVALTTDFVFGADAAIGEEEARLATSTA